MGVGQLDASIATRLSVTGHWEEGLVCLHEGSEAAVGQLREHRHVAVRQISRRRLACVIIRLRPRVRQPVDPPGQDVQSREDLSETALPFLPDVTMPSAMIASQSASVHACGSL